MDRQNCSRADSSILKNTLLPRVLDFSKPALRSSLTWREHAGWDNGTAATMSMHGTSPRPARCCKIRIRAGWANAFAKAARFTDSLSNASSFASGIDYIFKILNMIARGISELPLDRQEGSSRGSPHRKPATDRGAGGCLQRHSSDRTIQASEENFGTSGFQKLSRSGWPLSQDQPPLLVDAFQNRIFRPRHFRK